MSQSLIRIMRAIPLREKIVSIAVILFAFGGIWSAIFLYQISVISDPGGFFYGQIIAACLLAILAWMKEKKDIVSLLTPLYSIIIFVGLGISPNVLLQVLFALSLMILLVRLHLKFS